MRRGSDAEGVTEAAVERRWKAAAELHREVVAQRLVLPNAVRARRELHFDELSHRCFVAESMLGEERIGDDDDSEVLALRAPREDKVGHCADVVSERRIAFRKQRYVRRALNRSLERQR